MVHSELYYRMNETIIEDHLFDAWCRELVELQRMYPLHAADVRWADLFDGFDGSTGFHLTGTPWGQQAAQTLLRSVRKGTVA